MYMTIIYHSPYTCCQVKVVHYQLVYIAYAKRNKEHSLDTLEENMTDWENL